MLKNVFSKSDKESLLFIILLFLISIVFLHSILSTSKIMNNIHHINDVTFVSHNVKESLFKYKGLHLWTPYYYSGRPLYAQPEYYFLDFNFLYIVLFRDIFVAMNLATITYFFLAGLGMYFLFLAFYDNKKGAFISAIIYMLNGYMHSFVITGNLNVLAGYSLIPFAFMFFIKALQSRDYAKYSILSGVFIALQLFAGGTLLIPYEIVLFGIYALFYLFGRNLPKRTLKLVFSLVIILLVAFGISAVKLLPGFEFMDLSNRSEGVSYQEYLGHPIELSNFVHILMTNLVGEGISAAVGIAGFILLLFGLYNYKKRYVMFSIALLIFSILMAMKGLVADIFYKLPVFNQLRHIERALFLTAFSSSILAGAGFIILKDKVCNVIKINKKNIIFISVIILIAVELLFLQTMPKATLIVKPKEIPINDYISKDASTFRTINLALSTLVGASGYNYLSQLGIGTIKGGSGIWFNDYLKYLSIAQQSNPAKLWGILNNKYVISDKELDIKGLRFIDKFEVCKGCEPWEASGPYLYENLYFMPRAYFVDKSILTIGNQQNSNQLIYSLLLDNNFNPNNVVIIQGEKPLNQHTLSDLRKYDAIIITELDDSQITKLRSYVDNGGILLPDMFSNKNSISQDEIQNLFKELDGHFEEIEVIEYENNKATYNVKGKKGFLVLSERFSSFPGWEANGKDKKEILKANGIITAVFVDKDDKITFKYKPASFRKGLLITIVTSSLIVAFLGYSYTKRRGGKNKS